MERDYQTRLDNLHSDLKAKTDQLEDVKTLLQKEMQDRRDLSDAYHHLNKDLIAEKEEGQYQQILVKELKETITSLQAQIKDL